MNGIPPIYRREAPLLTTPSARGCLPQRQPRRRTARLLTALLLTAVPGQALAAGFALTEQSPAATGLAGALVARPDDASAIYYNPAGLGFQSGLSVLGGVTLIVPSLSATDYSSTASTNGVTYSTEPQLIALPTVFVGARLSDRWSIGVGGYSGFGSSVSWQDGNQAGTSQPFPGRFLAQRSSLTTFTINPTVAVRPIPEISLGFGVDVVLGSVNQTQSLPLQTMTGPAEGQLQLSGGSTGVGANFGALVRLWDGRFNFGLHYRTAVKLAFPDVALQATLPAGTAFPYTTAQTELPLPHSITTGVAVKPSEWLTVSVDLISTLWQDLHAQRLSLPPVLAPDGDKLAPAQVLTTQRSLEATYSGRLGLEGDLGGLVPSGSKVVPKVRLGFGFDQTPVPASTLDPSLPDASRVLTSVGVSLGYRGYGSLELGYQAVMFRPRASENPQSQLSYTAQAHVFSAAVVLQLENVFGRRSPEFAGRQLTLTPPPAPTPGTEGTTPTPPTDPPTTPNQGPQDQVPTPSQGPAPSPQQSPAQQQQTPAQQQQTQS